MADMDQITSESTHIDVISRPRDAKGRFAREEGGPKTFIDAGELEQVYEALSVAQTESIFLQENLTRLQLQVDAKGWTQLYEHGKDGGLTLDALKNAAAQLEELIAANPFMKQAAFVRSITTWGAGVEFSTKASKRVAKRVAEKDAEEGEEQPKTAEVRTPLTASVRRAMEHPKNQRYIFSDDAKAELETAAATAGNIFILGDDTAVPRTMTRLALNQISTFMTHEDNPEEIIMIRRVWSPDPHNKPTLQRVAWYYTDIFDGKRQSSVRYGDKNEPIDLSKTVIDKSFNRQIGWALGVPDGLPAMAWSRLYKEFMVNGFIMSKALASLAFKVTSSSAGGAQRAVAEVKRPGQQAGSTAVSGEGNKLEAVTTAGKGYDFDSGRPLAAGIAASFGVSISSVVGEAKGGNAQGEAALDSIARQSASMRRKSWEEFFGRILRYLGNTRELVVTWHDLASEDINRQLQAWTLVHGTGLFEGDIVQTGIAKAMQIPNPGGIPKGYMLQNNSDALRAAAEAVPTPEPVAGANDSPNGGSTGAGGATGGTGQGKKSPAGKAPNDHGTDDK